MSDRKDTRDFLSRLLGKGRDPDRMGYADEELYKNRNAHLKT